MNYNREVNKGDIFMEKDNIIELELEEGVRQHCVVWGFFEIGDIEYVGLMPLETEDCYIFRYEEDEEMSFCFILAYNHIKNSIVLVFERGLPFD